LLPSTLLWIIRVATLIYIIYNIVFSKPFINVFVAIIIQSVLLFAIRYFWQDKTFGDAFIHSFDIVTIVIVIIFGIFKLSK
jgi:hypothetical protein